MNISVIVGTFGDDGWRQKAEQALASVHAQVSAPLEAFAVHGKTLARARNEGAERALGDHLIFLDADDELDPGYVGAMAEAVDQHERDGRTFLFQPSTLGVTDGVEDPYPVMIPRRPLKSGNFMVIGTMVRKDVFERAGGFHEWPIYEDWDLWIRCQKLGAELCQVPEAIYRVHVTPGSRNNQDPKLQRRVFNEIVKANFR